ncbi:MAG: hypothetical protein FWC66_00690 [Oscillospiraceae bacterium]|nr:hypothetical protein [Oscillospiraceae bacterium]
MNIGIDVDGVLTDIHEFNIRHAPPFFKRKYDREVVDEAPYDIRDIFGCPDKEWIAYWKRYLLKYATVEPARKGAKEFTEKLYADGHEAIIITKRVFTAKKGVMGRLMRTLVRSWLKRNGILHREAVFCVHDDPDIKKAICLDKDVKIMIDDEPENIYAVADVAKAICFDTSYNRDCKGENIYRAKDFDEAYAIIERLGEIK